VLAVVLIIIIGKSLVAFVIVLLFHYPARIAFKISVSLAQIGEFSFILGTLGLSYGLLSEEANNLILAGALISITFNPLVFRLVNSVNANNLKHSKFMRWMDINSSDDDLSHLSKHNQKNFKDLVVLIGYGRLGRYLQQNMKMSNMDLVVVDINRELVESMRIKGVYAIVGDATFKETLKDANIDKATAIVVTVPNAYEVRRIVEIARELKADIEVLVKVHNDEEFAYFVKQKVDLVVDGIHEVADKMVKYLNNKISDKRK
jgi:monovalent cation:H+ antiporter-2, CPA2 family